MYDCYPSFAFGLHKDSWADESEGPSLEQKSDQGQGRVSALWNYGDNRQRGRKRLGGTDGGTGTETGTADLMGQYRAWRMEQLCLFFRWRTAPSALKFTGMGFWIMTARDNRKLAEVTDFASKNCTASMRLQRQIYIAGFAYLNDYDNEWDSAAMYFKVDAQSKESVFLFSQKNHTPYNSVYLEEGFRAEELQQYPLVICSTR